MMDHNRYYPVSSRAVTAIGRTNNAGAERIVLRAIPSRTS